MREYIATLRYSIDKGHPDYSESIGEGTMLMSRDTYRIDPKCFYGNDDIESWIKNDLMLMAGGGYNSDHIHDKKFHISWREII